MNKWQKYLQTLGLTDAESKVYLYSLKAGPMPVLEIARSVELSRVTIYNVIETLTKSGLMTSVQKGKKLLYTAEPPERIMALANNKINSMQATVKEINNNIEELKLMQSGDKPVVKMYEGTEAYQAIQQDMLVSKIEESREFGNLDDIERIYPIRYNEKFFKKMDTRNFKRKIFFITTKEDTKEKENTIRRDQTNKDILYSKKGDFHGDIVIYNNKVWISSFKGKQITVMIEDDEIANTMKFGFDKMWDKLNTESK